MKKYTKAELRAGTVRRLRTHLKSAEQFVVAAQELLVLGGDVAATAEALATAADRVLGSATALRTLDSLKEAAEEDEQAKLGEE